MQYWLSKSEPTIWSWEMQLPKGTMGESWIGVRKHQPQGLLKQKEQGEHCFLFQFRKSKKIVGVPRVLRTSEPESTITSNRIGTVTNKTTYPNKHIRMAWMKAQPKFQNMKLVKEPRFLHQPVSEIEWDDIQNQGTGA